MEVFKFCSPYLINASLKILLAFILSSPSSSALFLKPGQEKTLQPILKEMFIISKAQGRHVLPHLLRGHRGEPLEFPTVCKPSGAWVMEVCKLPIHKIYSTKCSMRFEDLNQNCLEYPLRKTKHIRTGSSESRLLALQQIYFKKLSSFEVPGSGAGRDAGNRSHGHKRGPRERLPRSTSASWKRC